MVAMPQGMQAIPHGMQGMPQGGMQAPQGIHTPALRSTQQWSAFGALRRRGGSSHHAKPKD